MLELELLEVLELLLQQRQRVAAPPGLHAQALQLRKRMRRRDENQRQRAGRGNRKTDAAEWTAAGPQAGFACDTQSKSVCVGGYLQLSLLLLLPQAVLLQELLLQQLLLLYLPMPNNPARIRPRRTYLRGSAGIPRLPRPRPAENSPRREFLRRRHQAAPQPDRPRTGRRKWA